MSKITIFTDQMCAHMRIAVITFIITILSFSLKGQDGFPVNGVATNFYPIYAFTNAHLIISPDKEIKNGTLLIQNKKILEADSNINIPEGAIIKDLEGDYIYPSFID